MSDYDKFINRIQLMKIKDYFSAVKEAGPYWKHY
jgi:hypothetical protein